MGLDIKKKSNFILECMSTIHTASVGLSPSMSLWFEDKFGGLVK